MNRNGLAVARQDGKISRATSIGFALPFLLALGIGILIHTYTKPVSNPIGLNAGTAAVNSAIAPVPTTLPSAADAASADASILDYCRNDLRQGTNCSLVANSNVAAPGFVESGVRMSGYFEGASSSTYGLALARGEGNSWSVIWVGQSCIPKDVASSNAVTQPLKVCQ